MYVIFFFLFIMAWEHLLAIYGMIKTWLLANALKIITNECFHPWVFNIIPASPNVGFMALAFPLWWVASIPLKALGGMYTFLSGQRYTCLYLICFNNSFFLQRYKCLLQQLQPCFFFLLFFLCQQKLKVINQTRCTLSANKDVDLYQRHSCSFLPIRMWIYVMFLSTQRWSVQMQLCALYKRIAGWTNASEKGLTI